MKNTILILLLAGAAACDSATDAVTRDHANEFPIRSNWSAALAPVGNGTVRAELQIQEHLGSRFDATVSLTGGAPNAAYQWRIFRGDCSVNTQAASNTSATGLKLLATIQSYPDVITNANGAGTASSRVAAALDSLTAYSVRVRVAQQATSWNGTNPIACGNLQRS